MKKKKELLVVGILIGIFCVVGVSYAVWQVTHVQTGENSLTVGCFKVEFTDLNPIQIGKAYPIEDKVGKTLTPNEFTITNTCNDLASYQINLEVLNDSTMNEHSYIKTMLDEESPNPLTSHQVVEKTLENATTAYKLKKSFLNANETKNFTLRLWLDKNTPADETIMNSVFKSKVTITTSFIEEAPLASGTLRSINYDDTKGMWQYKGQITKLIIEDELKPIEGAIGSFDESSKKDGSVMSYVVLEVIKMEILKVSSKSNPSKVAGAIANIYREQKEVEIQTIGAGSLNQAIKAVAIARGFVAPSGDNLIIIPAFNDITIDGENKTAMKLIITNK